MNCFENVYFLTALTFGCFFLAKEIQKRTGKIWLNPILITIIAIICFLKCTGISYDSYHEAGQMIEFWLQPAIVALGVPLYQQLRNIKVDLIPIIMSQLAGCIVGIVSCSLIAKWMGASDAVILSLAPKSVTTPIAMEVSKAIGGIPSLTAAIVILVGLFGAIFGLKILQIGRINGSCERGISIGTASHAIGTSRAWEEDNIMGTYSTLGLILNGVFTALLAPIVMFMLL